MKERPILFNGEMVHAILDGRKTQTRRMVKPQPVPFGEDSPFTQATLKEHVGKPWMPVGGVFQDAWQKPFGTIGDQLWVRETFRIYNSASECACYDECKCARMNGKPLYRASDPSPDDDKWTPSIHMPRWASRITLEITGVRVERVQDITEEDAKMEGVESGIWEREAQLLAGASDADDEEFVSFRDGFGFLWQSIYGNRPKLPANPESKRYQRVKRWLDKHPSTDWDANPWVWVYQIRRIKP